MGFVRVLCPVFAFLGPHNSGKTTAIEHVLAGLGGAYRVGVLKHAHAGFDVSERGKDSWRLLRAGARAVYVKSPEEEVFIYRAEKFGFEEVISMLSPRLDLILVEGFREEVEKAGYVYRVYLGTPAPPGHFSLSSPPTRGELNELLKRIKSLVKAFKGLKEVLELIPWLNCGGCGFRTCLEFLEALQGGGAKREDCRFLTDLGVEVRVDGRPIPLNPFVKRLVRGVVMGMLSCLKGVETEGVKRLRIELER